MRPKAIRLYDREGHETILQIDPPLNYLRFLQAGGHKWLYYEEYLVLCRSYRKMRLYDAVHGPPTREEMDEWLHAVMELFKTLRKI